MQLCKISKRLYGESTPCLIMFGQRQVREKYIFQRRRGVTKVRNSIINIHLPLMMFIRMHSQESQFHHKCLIMSISYVQIFSYVKAFGKQIQKRIQVQLDEKFKKLYYRSKKFVKLSMESIFRIFLT